MKSDNVSKLEKECKFFESNIDKIRKQYGETTYIAIHDQKIIDSDPDKFVLAKKYPNRVLLITSIKDYNRVVEIPSPEIR